MAIRSDEIPLKAKTAIEARKEIKARWPNNDVNYFGYLETGECVFMSLVRSVTKGSVATLKRNRSPKPTRFTAAIDK